jgi:hypothetical protein
MGLKNICDIRLLPKMTVIVVLDDTCEYTLPLLTDYLLKCREFLVSNSIKLGYDVKIQANDIYIDTVSHDKLGPLARVTNRIDFIEKEVIGCDFIFEYKGKRCDHDDQNSNWWEPFIAYEFYTIQSMKECVTNSYKIAKQHLKEPDFKKEKIIQLLMEPPLMYAQDNVCDRCNKNDHRHGDNQIRDGKIASTFLSYANEGVVYKFARDPGYDLICSLCMIEYIQNYELFNVRTRDNTGYYEILEDVKRYYVQNETRGMMEIKVIGAIREADAFKTEPFSGNRIKNKRGVKVWPRGGHR